MESIGVNIAIVKLSRNFHEKTINAKSPKLQNCKSFHAYKIAPSGYLMSNHQNSYGW